MPPEGDTVVLIRALQAPLSTVPGSSAIKALSRRQVVAMPRPPPTRRGPTSAARGRIRCEAMPPGRPQRCRAKLRRAHFGVSSPILNCLVIAAPSCLDYAAPFHYHDLHGDRTHDRPGAVCIASISSQLRLMPPGLQTSLAVVHPHRQRAPHTREYSNMMPPRPEGLTTVDVPTRHMHMPGDAHKRNSPQQSRNAT